MSRITPGRLRRFRNIRLPGVDSATRLLRGGSAAPHLPDGDLRRLRSKIDVCISERTSEPAGRARALEVAEVYLDLDDVGHLRFFELLAEGYQLDRDELDRAVTRWRVVRARDQVDEGDLLEAERELRAALVAPRERLLTRFNGLDGGVKFLVDMRADLLAFTRGNAQLASVETDLSRLLASWFDVGLLELRRITWDTPASLLEKLIEYEAVHAIESWADLKDRLDSDRRCYAFFHPGMPGEPLIFVEIALVRGLAESVQVLLDRSTPATDPAEADTAIFYSISACQDGLAGVNLGDFLIKRVVADLTSEVPQLRNFATLSPIPGFRAWLDRRLEENPNELIADKDLARLSELDPTKRPEELLEDRLATPGWIDDDATVAVLRPFLLAACARYLLDERRGRRAIDPVANFHLSNGARVEQINFGANTSPAGLDLSLGLMVNYRYELDQIEENHDAYVNRGRIARSGAVDRLLD